MPASHEGIARERGGMRGFQHRMPRGIDEVSLGASVIAPQEKEESGAVQVELPDDFVGKQLPSDAAVRPGLVLFNREDRIEQEDALPRPGRQVAMAWRGNAQVALQFAIDVAQR